LRQPIYEIASSLENGRDILPDVTAATNARILKVFIASPSDVIVEREALARLIRDINDVLAFLAPEKRLTLELVRYETHAYPDLGAPQDVINRQIPIDYDIFVGVMWKRAGTPTQNAASGTIEEFRRAVAKRKTSHLPRIMFYFCDEKIALPSSEELSQIKTVLEFRAELSKLGLTETYPSHTEFAEHVRGGLLRAMRDILREESHGALQEGDYKTPLAVDAVSQSAMVALASEYEHIRNDMPPSDDRTRRMTAVVSQMKSHASGAQASLRQFTESESAGQRLAAIAILQMFPSAEYLSWLAERLNNPEIERPFVGYMAAVAILEAVRALSASEKAKLGQALRTAKTLAERLPSDPDRIEVLNIAQQEYERRFERAATQIPPPRQSARPRI
jgi:hypothetical protein